MPDVDTMPGLGTHELIKKLRFRYSELKKDRDDWLPSWREINEFIYPWSGRFLQGDEDVREIRRGEMIYNSSTFRALQVAASGLHGGLTSPSRPWFTIVHADREKMEERGVKEWVYALQEAERRFLSNSNFYAEIYRLYYEVLAYGTGVMVMQKAFDLDDTIVDFHTLNCGEYCIANGPGGRVDTLYRRYVMTANELREYFGEENLSNGVKEELKQGLLDTRHYVVQAIQPYGTFTDKQEDGWEYETIYFQEDSGDEDCILRISFYRHKPFVAVRWGLLGDDAYGYGPGHMALADVRMLQTMERAHINAVNWVANPAIVVSESLKDRFSRNEIYPGAIIPANSAEGQYLCRPLYEGRFDFQNIMMKEQEVEKRISTMFYNDLFTMIANKTKQMTASEVQQLAEEKAIMLGPVFETFLIEIFNPILDFVYNIMEEEYAIPEMFPENMPQELRGAELKIEYISTIAQERKREGLTNLDYTLNKIAVLMQMNPEVIDKVNFDEIVDVIDSSAPVNPSIVRTDAEVKKMRDERAKAQQQQAETEQMADMAKAARHASQAEARPDNMLGQIMGMPEGAA